MEHSYIEEHDIVGRYLSGRLSDIELMRFEKHFLGCPQCVDRLETTEDIRAGLGIVAAEEALQSRTYIRAGLLARITRLRRAGPAVLIASFVFLVGTIAWLAWTWSGTRRDLIQAQQTSSEWRRKYDESAQAARDLAKEMQARERQASAERNELAAQLEGERETRARLADRLKRAARGEAVVPVFTLSMVRDSNPDLSKPVDELRLSPSSTSIILLLELEPDPDIQSYRAVVLKADGRSVWSRGGLKLNSKGGLALSFNSSLLKPNTYLLTLEGLTAEGRHISIAKYTFRIFAW